MAAAVHIIEDDSAVRDALLEVVASDGRRVYAHESPDAFFAGPLPGDQDVVVLDLCFPHSSGIEAAERLRRELPSAKIIVISGVRSTPYHRALEAITPLASFRKPLDVGAFAACLETLLGGT